MDNLTLTFSVWPTLTLLGVSVVLVIISFIYLWIKTAKNYSDYEATIAKLTEISRSRTIHNLNEVWGNIKEIGFLAATFQSVPEQVASCLSSLSDNEYYKIHVTIFPSGFKSAQEKLYAQGQKKYFIAKKDLLYSSIVAWIDLFFKHLPDHGVDVTLQIRQQINSQVIQVVKLVGTDSGFEEVEKYLSTVGEFTNV